MWKWNAQKPKACYKFTFSVVSVYQVKNHGTKQIYLKPCDAFICSITFYIQILNRLQNCALDCNAYTYTVLKTKIVLLCHRNTFWQEAFIFRRISIIETAFRNSTFNAKDNTKLKTLRLRHKDQLLYGV
jgi:hypothetical protein